MTAGSRNMKIRVEKLVQGDDDASGQPVEAWELFCPRWAEVVATGGSERYKGRQIQANMSHVVTVISDSKTRLITPGMRIIWRSRPLNIVVVQPLDGVIREIQILCTEQVDP